MSKNSYLETALGALKEYAVQLKHENALLREQINNVGNWKRKAEAEALGRDTAELENCRLRADNNRLRLMVDNLQANPAIQNPYKRVSNLRQPASK